MLNIKFDEVNVLSMVSQTVEKQFCNNSGKMFTDPGHHLFGPGKSWWDKCIFPL